MRKKVICFILVIFSMVNLVCYSEDKAEDLSSDEIQVIGDTVQNVNEENSEQTDIQGEEQEKNDVPEYKKFLERIHPELISAIEKMSVEFGDYSGIKISTDDLDAEHKAVSYSAKLDFTEFLDGFFKLIEDGVDVNKEVVYANKFLYDTSLYGDVLLYGNMQIGRKNSASHGAQITITVTEDAIRISSDSTYSDMREEMDMAINNSEAIIEYIQAYSDYLSEDSSNYKTTRYDSDNPYEAIDNMANWVHTDTIEFDFILTSGYEGTIEKEVANAGEKVNAVFKKYNKVNNKKYFLYTLTLSGSKGEYIIWTEESIKIGADAIYSNNIPLNFINTHRCKKDLLVNYVKGDIVADIFRLKLTFESGDIKEVLLDNIKCENLKYTSVTDDETLSEQFVEKDKEALLEQQRQEAENAPEAQDPEYYITKIKNVYDDGESVIDYYIPFAAQVDVDFSGVGAPEWYKKLGKNVKMTVVGMTQTLNGEDRRHYTMLQFKGDNGVKWFDNSRMQVNPGEASNPTEVYGTYNSLISFDGTEKIENTINYDTVYVTFHFEEDGNKVFDGIDISIDSVTEKISEKEVKYIGGEMDYEKIW